MADKIYVVHQTDGYDVHNNIGYFHTEQAANECAAHARKQERARNRQLGLGRHYDHEVIVIEETIYHTLDGWLKAQSAQEGE